MKWPMMVLLAVLCSCGGDLKTPAERLVGHWDYSNPVGGNGIELQFTASSFGDTYMTRVWELFSLTGTAAYEEVETGEYAATDSQITFTPTSSTCPSPVPVYAASYTFDEDSLRIVEPTRAFTLVRRAGGPSSGATIFSGCFQPDGSFVHSSFAPVTN
jgi:hypothetical protein